MRQETEALTNLTDSYAREIMKKAGVPEEVRAEAIRTRWDARPASMSALTWVIGGGDADAYAAWLCANRRGSLYVDVPALLLDLKGLDAYGADSMASRFSAMQHAGLLALAGLDAARWQSLRLELLAEAVTVRARARMPTVIASSRGLDDTTARLGAQAGHEAASAFCEAVMRAMGGTTAERLSHVVRMGERAAAPSDAATPAPHCPPPLDALPPLPRFPPEDVTA